MDFVDLTKLTEFDNHKLVVYVVDDKTGLEGFIVIHRGNLKHPSFGATRLWDYSSRIEALKDALRLSKTMSYKAALAGLPCGGAKAAIYVKGKKLKNREMFLKAYAKKVNFLGGHFVTGSDVGINREDVKLMRRVSPHFVGIKTKPERYTALGLLYSIKVCLKEVYRSDLIEGRSIALKGLGKVGFGLLALLYPKTRRIYVSDINNDRTKRAKEKFPDIEITSADTIHEIPIDVFSPCAMSNSINSRNVNQLKCKIIVGGANSQLEKDGIGELLHQKGILYAPDYIVNAGGLISVYDEYENSNCRARRVSEKVERIGKVLEEIIRESKTRKKSTISIANEKAEKVLSSLE